MITIASKSKLDKEHISDKVSRGSRFLEIALMSELDEMTPTELFEKAKRDGVFSIIDVVAVHAPANKIDCLIEAPICHERIERTCSLAELIAREIKHEVIVVLHTSTNPQYARHLGIYDSINTLISKQLSANPNISLGIESHSEFDYAPDKCELSFNPSFTVSNGKAILGCVQFASEFNSERIHAVIDTCHVTMIQRYLSLISTLLQDESVSQAAQNMLRDNLAVIGKAGRHIHLANAIGHGYGFDKHGVTFSPEDPTQQSELDEQMLEISNSGFTGNIVLEVSEVDYTNSINYSMTRDAITRSLNALDLEHRF